MLNTRISFLLVRNSNFKIFHKHLSNFETNFILVIEMGEKSISLSFKLVCVTFMCSILVYELNYKLRVKLQRNLIKKLRYI